VFLPVLLGLLWRASPEAVFFFAAVLAAGSFVLATFIPRHPAPGQETIFGRELAAPAE